MDSADFTGERYLPGQGGAQIAYEHIHRYLFAAGLAHGQRVLDVACGSGYGAAIVAHGARRVFALDLDMNTIVSAQNMWKKENLFFLNADGTALPFRGGQTDVVIALEVLEHIEDQEGFIREIARVCAPDGIAIISTPNKAIYSDARHYRNPFHLHEFYRDEFLEFLSSCFSGVRLFDQQMRAGSLIAGDPATIQLGPIITAPSPDDSQPIVEAMYFIALCCPKNMISPQTARSAYFDLTDALLKETCLEYSRLNAEIRRLGSWGHSLEETVNQKILEIEGRDRLIASLQEEMRENIERRDQEIRRLQDEFDERSRWALDLEEEVAARDARLKHANDELQSASEHLIRIRHAFVYRVLHRLKILPD
jgi:SAM-dependent methyltransferase